MKYEDLKKAALDLPEKQKAELVELLIEQLERPLKEAYKKEWFEVAEKRAEEIDANEKSLISEEELEYKLRNRKK